MSLDDRTPVIVGVGQVSERLDDADYSAASPAELAGRAARAACEDTGVGGLGAHIDVIAGIRQFEISRPTAVAPFGRSDNLPRAIGRRVGADPRRALMEITGGHAPQKLVNELAHSIAAGDAGMVLLAGAEAISTVRHLLARGETRDWSEAAPGDIEDRGYGVDGRAGEALINHGAARPAPLYAMFENARRGRLGLAREAYRLEMGRLFAPFTEVAAANPHAMSRQVFTAEEIATVTPGNRLICDPFPRRVVSRDQANQGAAVLLTSAGKARALGIAEDRWIYLHGGADVQEKPVIDRADLSMAPGAVLAVRQALELAGLDIAGIDLFDLYSCFPVAVFNIADAFGLAADDPRRLTVTGGLPFFGGAGNNYSMHAIAEMVGRLRARPGASGLVGANGGYMSKYSVGVYSTEPAIWRGFSSKALQDQINAEPGPMLAESAPLRGVIETFTIDYGVASPRVIAVGRNGADERFVACTEETGLIEAMRTDDPMGAAIETATGDDGLNRIVRLL